MPRVHPTTTWKRYAPEGKDWEPPRADHGGMQRSPTTTRTLTLLVDRAVSLYWKRRPNPAETVVPLP